MGWGVDHSTSQDHMHCCDVYEVSLLSHCSFLSTFPSCVSSSGSGAQSFLVI